MSQGILVINAGSSSLKFTLFEQIDDDATEATSGQIAGIGSHPRFKAEDGEGQKQTHDWGKGNKSIGHGECLSYILDWLKENFGHIEIIAAGHRVVHGGLEFTTPVKITDETLAKIIEKTPLAPLHQPHNIAPIEILRKLNPSLTQVAVFDTAFHRTQPELAQMYAIPRELIEEDQIRRYGMHGISYEYIAHKLEEVAPEVAKGRVVVAHIGSGASLAALKDGKSQATTMGFTALEGLPMGTRPGNIDAGILLWLMQNKGFDANRMEKFLYHECGMLGFTQISNDFYEVETSDDPRAKQGYALMGYQTARQIASLSAAIGGMDAIVFTAGVGERGPLLRGPVCEQLSYFGIELDEKANNNNEFLISTPNSKVKVMVIPTNEELMIARHTLHLL
ncbi:MAG: acetate/propionate family kinase [Alphaproteobacteria bacterium]